MKKILIINGSIRKHSTYSLLKRIESFFGNYDVEFINIKDYIIKPCIGCENCIRKGECNFEDDASALLLKMSSADALVIGSPVYMRQISGYLKLLIDRGCAWYHRPALAGKPVLFVTSTQVSGTKQAVRYFKDLSVQWGAMYSGAVSRMMFNFEKPVQRENVSRFLLYLENKGKYKPGIKQIFEFNTQKVLAVSILPLDKMYWEEKGYINMSYYYDCRINSIKRLAGYAYYIMLSYFLNKNKTEQSEQ